MPGYLLCVCGPEYDSVMMAVCFKPVDFKAPARLCKQPTAEVWAEGVSSTADDSVSAHYDAQQR